MAHSVDDSDVLLGKDSPEALAVTEASRESEWHYPSFVADLFLGKIRTDLVHPYPKQREADRKIGDEFLEKLSTFLKSELDPDEIDRTREVPARVLQGLAELGCFGMKIPTEYGGLGLSQTNYNRAIALLGSYCGTTTVWLSAHQSIGAPQPLMLFGTDEQKKKYLPKLAKGTVSAFALTEPGVGSDPANMLTTAVPTEDGQSYILNGEKLWCTNGPVADVIVVMAQTPAVTVNGRERKQITAFIVEKSMPGFEVVHRCDFMGLKGIQNGVLRFTQIKVPKENIIWGTGKGLKLALVTLNAGRIAIPAGSVGTAKKCIQFVREWSKERNQWGKPVGEHEAVAEKIGQMAATTFAMDAMVWLTSSLVDRKTIDIRLEAAMAKLYCSEQTWQIVDDALQIRGGRGYETADSLKARNEEGVPLERIMRDTRINRIIEGTSDIMHLFIAREALDSHMQVLTKMLSKRSSLGQRVTALLKAGVRYALWYPQLWLSWGFWPRYSSFGSRLGGHMRFAERMSRKLALNLFHSAMVHQIKLADKQLRLARLVDVGCELFAMISACSKASSLLKENPSDKSPEQLADLYCKMARRRIKGYFSSVGNNEDKETVSVSQSVLNDELRWMETGII